MTQKIAISQVRIEFPIIKEKYICFICFEGINESIIFNTNQLTANY